MGEGKKSIRGLLVDPKPNSPNQHRRNCITDINPLTPKISLAVLLTVCKMILIMLVRRIGYQNNY